MSKTKYETMVLKVQLPLFSSGPAEILYYNGDRSIEGMLPLTKDVIKHLDDDPKQFWLAEVPVEGKGSIKLNERVEDPGW